MKKYLPSGSVVACLSLAASHALASTVTIGNSGFTQHSQYVTNAVTSPEVHMIGLYDGGSSAGYSNPQGIYIPGTTQVNVLGFAGGPVSLVLSSYEQTNWVLTGPGVDSLASVLVNGYGPSQAIGIDLGKVINRSGPGNYITACAFAWPADAGGCNTPGLVSGVESLFGTPIASFTGIYSSSLTLGKVTSVASPADLQVTVQLSPIPIPTAAWLLGSALGVLGWMRSKWVTWPSPVLVDTRLN